MKMLSRTLLPALLCAVILPSTCQAKWCLFSRLKCHRSCQAAPPCSTPCAEQPVACDGVYAAAQTITMPANCCSSIDDSSWAGSYEGSMPVEMMPSETVHYGNEVQEGIIIHEAPLASDQVAEPMPIQPVAAAESNGNEEALAESEKALKRAKAEAKNAKAELETEKQEFAAAIAVARAASKEQLDKLRTQNANLKKNLDAARKRIERMQGAAGNQQAKREDEPTAKAARDTQGKGKKPGDRKPANQKQTEGTADNAKPAAKQGKKAAADKANNNKTENK